MLIVCQSINVVYSVQSTIIVIPACLNKLIKYFLNDNAYAAE